MVFWSCAGGNLRFQFRNDWSGLFWIYQKEILQPKVSKSIEGSGYESRAQSTLVITEKEYAFPDLRLLRFPGVSFVSLEEGIDQWLLVGLDTSSKSPLIKSLGLNSNKSQAWKDLALMKDDLFRFNQLIDHLVVEVVFPYPVEDPKFVEDRDRKEWDVRLDLGPKLVIKIPIIALEQNLYEVTQVQVKRTRSFGTALHFP